MSKFALTAPITIGDLTIWPHDPPPGYQPKPGTRHFQLDTQDPLFATFAKHAETEGFSDAEFQNALAMFAGATAKAEADGTQGDAAKVRERLAGLIGDGAADFEDVLGNPDQLGALGLVLDHLHEKQEAAAKAPTQSGQGEGAMSEADLKRLVASDEYQKEASADGPLHRKVADGYAKLYPAGEGPADRSLGPTGSRRAEPPPVTGGPDAATVAALKARVADPRQQTDPTFQAETAAAFKAAYPGQAKTASIGPGDGGRGPVE